MLAIMVGLIVLQAIIFGCMSYAQEQELAELKAEAQNIKKEIALLRALYGVKHSDFG